MSRYTKSSWNERNYSDRGSSRASNYSSTSQSSREPQNHQPKPNKSSAKTVKTEKKEEYSCLYGVVVVKIEKDNTITVYARDNKLHSINVPSDCELKFELGSWIEFDNKEKIASYFDVLPTEVVEGKVNLKSVAAIPNKMLLDKELRPKYAETVWSPYLGNLRGREKFLPYSAEKPYHVTVIFDPSDDVIWRVENVGAQIYDPNMNLMVSDAPWKLEQVELQIANKFENDIREMVMRDRSRVSKDEWFCGFVYEYDESTFEYYIWCFCTGTMVVCEEEAPEVGKWFNFNIHTCCNTAYKTGKTQSMKYMAINLYPVDSKCEVVIDENIALVRTKFELNANVLKRELFMNCHLGKVILNSEVLKQTTNKLRITLNEAANQKLKITALLILRVFPTDRNRFGWQLDTVEKIEKDDKVLFNLN